MKTPAFLLALALGAGCSSTPASFDGPLGTDVEHARLDLDLNATIAAITYGIELGSSGDVGLAGFGYLTCEFDADGYMGTDYEYGSNTVRVEDSDGDVVLVSTTHGLSTHQLTAGGGFGYIFLGDNPDWELTGVEQARFVDGGLVAMHRSGEDCTVSWQSGAAAQLDGPLCDSSFTADPDTGDAWLAHATGLYQVTSQGWQRVADSGGLADFDTSTGLVYTSMPGRMGVVAVDSAGDVAWSRRTIDTVTAIEAIDARGAVAVGLHKGPTHGSDLAVLADGASGESWSVTQVPDAPTAFAASGDGTGLVLVTSDGAQLFEVQEL